MNDTEKKAIEEMAKFMLEKSNSANVEPVFTTNEGQEIVLGKDLTMLLNDVLEQAFIPFLAEALYSAGYHKQSEGEWTGTNNLRHCSKCGNVVNFNNVSSWLYNYCPNCGAKMNGGE